jgi:putative transposase
LNAPADRDGTFQAESFRCMECNELALTLSLMEMYLERVSTRKVRDVTEALCGRRSAKAS